MSRSTSPRFRRYMRDLRAARGNRCEECGVLLQVEGNQVNLQFAHITPTGLRGHGRGRNRRILDIRKNPGSYRLLCLDCHERIDHEEKEV